jgi:hypothetical protein
VLIVAGWVLRSRQRKAQAPPPTPPTQATPPAS